jgi:hypothetical protein
MDTQPIRIYETQQRQSLEESLQPWVHILKTDKLNSQKNQQPNEEMGKWTEQTLFKGRSPNG